MYMSAATLTVARVSTGPGARPGVAANVES